MTLLYQHIVGVETLDAFRPFADLGDGEPLLFIANHVDVGLSPLQQVSQYRAALLPLGNLGPQNIVDLLAGRRGGDHAGIWKTGQKPQQRCGLKACLTNALP